MKQINIVAAVLLIATLGMIACQEDETGATALKADGKIGWKDVETAAKTAQSQDKKLFVYIHTDWCSWCRKMEEETFSSDDVAEYLNDKFIPVHLDAESQHQVIFNGQQISKQDLAVALGAQGYPSNIFLTSNGETITIAPGYMPPDRFLKVLSFIAEDHYEHTKWEEYSKQEGG